MKNKKTGILTLSSAQNYGAVLQSFSLLKYLQLNYGETEIINFVPGFIVGRYNLIRIDDTSIYKRIISVIKGIIKLPIPLMTRIRFNIFRKKYCTYSKKKYVRSIEEDIYDQYIVGSDQVFNLSLTRNEKTFFLPFIKDARKKATYAASLGVDCITTEQRNAYYEGLKDFDYISIREQNGVDILKEVLTDKSISCNIDPVFLNNKSFWSKIAYDYNRKEKYVLVYSLANNAVYKSISIAKKFFPNYRIVFVTDSISKADPSVINQRGVGPQQFLGLIRDAECVITNSFHGCAFSIIFEKEFYVVPFQGTSSRMINLLKILGLDSRLALNEDDIAMDEIDYSLVRKKIKKEVNRAKEFFDSVYYG